MTYLKKNNLKNIKLLSHLSESELMNFKRQIRWWNVASGKSIIHKESDNRDVFFVLAGSVRVVNYSSSGREIALANFKVGEYFGEIAAIDGKPRSANAIAVSDCVLASIAPSIFRSLIKYNSNISMEVMKRFAQIIRIADERIMDLSTLKVVQRVYIELLKMVERDVAAPELWVIRPMLSHSAIASHVGTTRETVARVLGQLAQAKIVERKSKALYIRNKKRLEELAEQSNPEGMISPS